MWDLIVSVPDHCLSFYLLSPPVFYTDRSKAVLLLWFLTVTCSCCPYLYFGWMDELGFYIPSTVFQSFRDDGSVNMKGSVQ